MRRQSSKVIKYLPLSIKAIIGDTIGGNLRANDNQNNFNGRSLNISKRYQQFTFDNRGNKVVL